MDTRCSCTASGTVSRRIGTRPSRPFGGSVSVTSNWFRLHRPAGRVARLLPDVGLVAPTAHAFLVDPDHVTHEPDRGLRSVAASRREDGHRPNCCAGAGGRIGRHRDDRGPPERVSPQAAAHGLTIGYHNDVDQLKGTRRREHALEVLRGLLVPEVVLEVDLTGQLSAARTSSRYCCASGTGRGSCT